MNGSVLFITKSYLFTFNGNKSNINLYVLVGKGDFMLTFNFKLIGKKRMNNKEFYKSKISLLTLALMFLAGFAIASDSDHDDDDEAEPVTVEMFAPGKNDRAGINGRGWFVDLAITYEGGVAASGFTDFQLTGPGPHDDVAPFPGTFSLGADDRLPGLIVLVKTTTIGAQSCQNLANLFNLTGVTNVTKTDAEIWDTWIVGAPLFGKGKTKIYVAVAADINNDGIYNDAPNAVPDADGNGVCNKKDLKAFGVSSNIVKEKFFIN